MTAPWPGLSCGQYSTWPLFYFFFQFHRTQAAMVIENKKATQWPKYLNELYAVARKCSFGTRALLITIQRSHLVLHTLGSRAIYHENRAMIYGSPSTHLDPHHLSPTFWRIQRDGLGWVPWRPQGIVGPGRAACHQVLFTLGACQSKPKTSLWSSVKSLECLYASNSAPHHQLPTPSGLHTSVPLILPCALLLSLCSSLPLVTPSWNPLSTVPRSYPHIPPYLRLKLCNPKIELEKKSGTERA